MDITVTYRMPNAYAMLLHKSPFAEIPALVGKTPLSYTASSFA